MLYTDNIGLKKPAYSEPADIADINENSDIIDREFGNRYLKSETYSVEQANNAIAQAIEALPNGLVYRGAVNYYKDLPTVNNELGDTYSVKYQGETGTTADGNEYAWGEYDGTLQWIKLGVNAYTKNEIDEQREAIKSDILNVESTINNTVIPKIGSDISSSLLSVGWYRVLVSNRKNTARNGIIMINRAFSNTSPENYIILFDFGNNSNTFRMLSKKVEGASTNQLIDAIRLVYAQTSGFTKSCYIDLHYNSTISNAINVSIFDESMRASGAGASYNDNRFVASDFSAAEIPEGYTSMEFSLAGDDIFTRVEALETALSQTQTE